MHRAELIFYIGPCVVGAIPLAAALHDRSDEPGVEPTIGLMMIIAGIAGLYAAWRSARRVRDTAGAASIHPDPGSTD